MATPNEMIEFIEQKMIESIKIMKAKNTDYGATSADAFANFTAVATLGIPPETGFITRMMDKMMRIASLTKNGEAQVKDEAIEDTLNDLSNYCLLFMAYRHFKKMQEKPDYKNFPINNPLS